MRAIGAHEDVDGAPIDVRLSCAIGEDQGRVADQIDESRDAPTVMEDGMAGIGREDVGTTAGGLESVPNVATAVFLAQAPEMIGRRDALNELFESRLTQLLAQFRLTEQEQLEQDVVLGVDVGQQPDLFERVAVEVLRLVDDEQRLASLGVFGEQEVDEGLMLRDPVVARRLDVECRADPVHDPSERLVGV